MTLRLIFIHLRFQFQLLLAPVWLWGWLIAGGGLHVPVLVGLVAFQAFLYTGVTAFNSFYDRDVGPVGGLEAPPPVPELLLPFALLLQLIGLALCALINPTVVVLYAGFMLLSVAYSHPRIRVKAHPFSSLLLVAFGQGVLVFASAWASVRGSLEAINSRDGVIGGVAAALLVLALYPLTQVYQVDEDAARGDRTLAVVWGPRAACWFAIACTCAGGACLLLTALFRFGVPDAALIALGLGVQTLLMTRLAEAINARADMLALYRRTMRLLRLSAVLLGGYLLARLIPTLTG